VGAQTVGARVIAIRGSGQPAHVKRLRGVAASFQVWYNESRVCEFGRIGLERFFLQIEEVLSC
jgi:hypothetical protein